MGRSPFAAVARKQSRGREERMNIRTIVCALVALIAIAHSPARSDDYPQRAVTFVCPFPAGGGTDILTRMLAQELAEKLKQPFVVENKPGAATLVGAQYVAQSKPDGYTLFLAPVTTLAINPNIYKTLP